MLKPPWSSLKTSHEERWKRQSRKWRRGPTCGFHSALNCICDLCWIFQPESSRSKCSQSHFLHSYGGNPPASLTGMSAATSSFSGAVYVPWVRLPTWAFRQGSWRAKVFKWKSRASLGPCSLWQTVAAAFTWAFSEVLEPFIQSDIEGLLLPPSSKRTWPSGSWNISHTSDVTGEVEERDCNHEGDWTSEDRAGRWLTHVFYVQLWSWSLGNSTSVYRMGRSGISLQNDPSPLLQMGSLGWIKAKALWRTQGTCFKQLWEVSWRDLILIVCYLYLWS